jgi:hypothetical protein
VALARLINAQMPGAAVLPWEVDEIDEIWLDVFRTMTQGGALREEARQRVQTAKANWLSRHPTYGK